MEDRRKKKQRDLFWTGYLFLLLGLLCWKSSCFVLEKIEEKKNTAAVVYSVEYTIAENLECLQGLFPEKWAERTEEEKWEILQTAANAEANYLGVRKPLTVIISDLEGDVRGRYVLQDHEIQIDREHVSGSPPEEVLATICHEAYHAYQTAMVEAFLQVGAEKQELLLFRKAEIYQEELRQYKNGMKGYEEYRMQELEQDARAYSRSAVKDWYDKLECRTLGS